MLHRLQGMPRLAQLSQAYATPSRSAQATDAQLAGERSRFRAVMDRSPYERCMGSTRCTPKSLSALLGMSTACSVTALYSDAHSSDFQ